MSFYRFKSLQLFFVFIFIPLNLTNGENSIRKPSDEFDEILNWEPPHNLKKNFPYFLSGFDDDGCPIWIAELGKWDIPAEIGTFGFEQVQKYVRQMLTTFYTSGERERNKETVGNNQTETAKGECESHEYNCIVDMDGFSSRQFLHPPTISTYLNLARVTFSLETKGERIKTVIGINVNHLASAVYAVGSPLIGSLASRVTLFGTNPNSWKPTLLKTFPKSALPDWMGGFKDFKPIKVYG